MPCTTRVLTCALALTSMVFAQKPPQQVNTVPVPAVAPVPAKDAYASEAVVVDRLDTVWHFNADGTGTKLDTDSARLQTEAAVRSFGVISIPYAAGTQKLEVVYLRVRKADGTVIETPSSDAQDQPAPVTQAAPFYSDLHLMQIPIRGLAVGDRVEYQVRTVLTKAEAEGHFWGADTFGQGTVVLERSIELRVPAGKYVNVRSPKFPARITDEGGEKVYHWTGSQLKPTPKPKADGQAVEEETAEEDKFPPIAFTTFHSWAEVGEWYRGIALDRSTVTPALKAKADEIVAGATTPEAKSQALYAYVGSHIRYIGVAFGIGRYQPHTAAEVLTNQYGDCKDKHTLLAALLRAEDLPVSAVLIGAGMELDEAVPAPSAFNHLITLTSDAQHNPVWLDATTEIAPYRMLDASIRDKRALVIPAIGEATLQRTPADPPFPVFSRFEAAGTLQPDGKMNAHVDLTMRGDDEIAFRQVLRSVTPGQWDRVTQFYVRNAGFAGDPSNTVADAPEKNVNPLHVGYDYARAPYGDWDNFKIIPLQPLMSLPYNGVKTAPAKELVLGSPHTDTAVSKITLPAGYSADLPAAVHLHTDFATLDKTYRLEKAGDAEVLVTERILAFKTAKLPRARWSEYHKFLDDIGDNEPWVQLTSTTASSAAGHHPPLAGANNAVAEELVRQAGQAEQARDWSGAKEKLDQAKAVNPRQPILWSHYGFVAEWEGKLNEAVEDYRRELKEYPEEASASRSLASVLMRQGKSGEADTVLQAALERDPRNTELVLLRSWALSSTDLPGAEKVLRTGAAASPENHALEAALGETLIKEGKRDEGMRLLSVVASSSDDPAQLNGVAYALADVSMNLPIAEAASRKSIQLLNAATSTGETGVASQAALRRAMLLIASWDTYGWVLYQEGNISEAEPWLRAAWVAGYGAESGLHLAMVLDKEGHPAEALRVLHLAAEGEPASDVRKVQKAIHDQENLLERTSKMSLPDGKTTLQKQRTFAVARGTNTADGWALFELEYTADRAPATRFVHGEQGLAGLAPSLAKLQVSSLLPPGSSAHLLRRGILSCHTGATCNFVFLPPMEALRD